MAGSPADQISRRAVIGGGIALAALPGAVRAGESGGTQHIAAPAGNYLGQHRNGVGGAGAWSFPGIRYGRA
ncbi:MAG: hypothetical protein KGL44_06565, partial [Sphingomonadales bacterium]|nr:hypothetical protein [Sphingomonadales bacterium]